MTLRIHVLSDLHLECQAWSLPRVNADLIVLAGDIADLSPVGEGRRRQLLKQIHATRIPTVYVMGNHEGYAGWKPRDELRRHIDDQLPANVHLLDRSTLDLGGYRILGCGLWSDFSLVHGLRRLGQPVDRLEAMHVAATAITDFQFLCDDTAEGKISRVTPERMSHWHLEDRRWLENNIAGSDRPVVVVTHFLPAPQCVSPRFAGSVLNAYFATDCRDLIRDPVRLWIHGHTHDQIDTHHNDVRIVCNPRGYAPHEPNRDFDARLVIDVRGQQT